MEKRVVWLHTLMLLCMTVLMVRLAALGQALPLAQRRQAHHQDRKSVV